VVVDESFFEQAKNNNEEKMVVSNNRGSVFISFIKYIYLSPVKFNAIVINKKGL
jgi:hypothetical protein